MLGLFTQIAKNEEMLELAYVDLTSLTGEIFQVSPVKETLYKCD